MSKKSRVYISGSIAKGTVIRITDHDILLSANRNRVFTTNWDHFSKEHIVPRELLQLKAAELDPPIAEFLLAALLSRARADAVIGDLNERFTREFEELGRRRAIRLYWARTFESLWPLLRRAIGKALKWGVVIDTVRRHF